MGTLELDAAESKETVEVDLCKDGFWIRMSRHENRGRLSLVRREDGGTESVVANFDFRRGELEQVADGISYQQATHEGHVSMREHHGEVEIEFKSKRARQSHACAIQSHELVAHLERIWSEG